MEDYKFTEVKETQKISEETKKTQDKIILITRITGVVIFLIGISIIFQLEIAQMIKKSCLKQLMKQKL